MESLVDLEEKVSCPYNKSHYIQRRRMAFHIVKCKKNYPESRTVTCDFNANHQVPEIELQYHHENCPNRANIEAVVYQESGCNINKFPVTNLIVQTEESWDDYNESSYDPQAYCQSHNVLRKLDVQPPSKKKDFRIEERHRMQEKASFSSTESHSDAHHSRRENVPIKPLKKNITLPEVQQDQSESEQLEDGKEIVSDLMAKIQLGRREAFVPKVVGKK